MPSPRFRLLAVLAMLVPSTAGAQGFDAMGPVPVATDGDPNAPMTLRSALVPRSLSAGLTGQYVGRPLTAFELVDGEPVPADVLLGSVVAGNLGVAWGTGPIGFTATVPLVFSSLSTDADNGPANQGFSLGDTRLAAQLGVDLRDDESGNGLMLGLSPVLRVPSGDPTKYLGDTGVGFELIGSGAVQAGPLRATLNAGVAIRDANDDTFRVNGGVGPIVGAAAAYSIDDQFSVGAEIGARGGLQAFDGLDDVTQLPFEAYGTARYKAPSGLFVHAGAGRGMSGAVGSSTARIFLGAGFAAPTKEETVEPEQPPQPIAEGFYAIDVRNPERGPVVAAVVTLDGERLGITNDKGRLLVEDKELRGWRKDDLVIEANGYESSGGVTRTEDDEQRTVVMLQWKPTPIELRVRDEKGEALVAQIAIAGVEGSPFAVVDGVASVELPPGEHTAVITAEGYGVQQRLFVLEAGNAKAETVDAILHTEAGPSALDLAVTNPEGSGVAGALLRIDGNPYGETGSGGVIRVEGLAEGEHRVEVIHDDFQAVGAELVLSAGDNNFAPMLRRLPGSVQVVARIPEGPVDDATVTFIGPSRLAPAALGGTGERIFVLRPGTWTALVASPTYGIQSREVRVPDDRTELTIVDVVLVSENGTANLDLRVVDPDGAPAEGVEINLDGVSLGTTSSGGNVELKNLNVGARKLSLSGDRRAAINDVDLFLVDGPQEKLLTVDWLPGTIRMHARTKSGDPVDDAVARFAGGAQVDSVALSDRGIGWTNLGDGRWQVLLTSPTYGLLARNVEVPADSRRVIPVDLVLDAVDRGDSDLLVTVTDPDGNPVSGASVALDGVPLGSTVNGVLDLEDIGEGKRVLTTSAVPFVEATLDVDLAKGANAYELPLSWAPGALKVTVKTDAGKPIEDAMVRLAGPSPVDPVRVDEDGERLMQLSPGSWQLLVTSPTFGFAAQPLVIDDVASELTSVDVTMADIPEGQSTLLVRVMDRDGMPIEGAKVVVGGVEKGVTAAGGGLLVGGLTPTPTQIAASASAYVDNDLGEVEVRPGSTEQLVYLDWVPTKVEVTVRDNQGKPVADAEVVTDGPYETEPVKTNASGRAEVALKPGAWRVLARTAELGAKSSQLTVEVGETTEKVELQLDAAKVTITGEQVVISDKIPFEITKSTLKPEAKVLLDEIADTLLAYSLVTKVEVQGHTDSTGSLQRNLELSEERAKTVMDALIARGVAPERLVARGYGATSPIADNETFDGRKQNRRVQFEILEATGEKMEVIVRDGEEAPE